MTTRGLLRPTAAGLALAALVLAVAGCCTGQILTFKSNTYKTTVGVPLQLEVGHRVDTDGPGIEWGYEDRVSWEVEPPDGATVAGAGIFTATAPGTYKVWAKMDAADSASTEVIVSSAAKAVYENHNDSQVFNGGTPASFELETPTTITSIENYHYGEGKGTPGPGTIGLVAEDGTTYGPWKTKATAGQGGVPNAYWTASPNIALPPGTYTIQDSDPRTWSQNSGSGGVGMTRVTGAAAK